MADNYLEKKFEDMRARQDAAKAKAERARQRAWKKRMEAYRKRLETEAAEKLISGAEVPDDLGTEVASDSKIFSVGAS